MASTHSVLTSLMAAALFASLASAQVQEVVIVKSWDTAPLPGSVYNGSDPVTFIPGPSGGSELRLDMLELLLAVDGVSVALPGEGETSTYTCAGNGGDCDDGYHVGAAFSYTPPGGGQRIAIEEEGVKQHFPNQFSRRPVGGPVGMYATELTELEFSFLLGDGSSVRFRESPTLASVGEHNITPLSADAAEVASFFDLYLEVSYDEGAMWYAASEPVSMSLTRVVPEPASAVLAMLAVLGVRFRWRS